MKAEKEPRQAPIGALDAALWAEMSKVNDVDSALDEFLDRHLDILDRLDELIRARSDVYNNVRKYSDTIRELGFVVVLPDGKTLPRNDEILDSYSVHSDRDRARERRAARTQGPDQQDRSA